MDAMKMKEPGTTALGKWQRGCGFAVALMVSSGIHGARAVVVTDWNAIAAALPIAAPPVQGRMMAAMHGAVHDAINSIDPRYEPYRLPVQAPAGASVSGATRETAMQFRLRLPDFPGRDGEPAAPRLISWPSLWRGGLVALAIIVVLSTQFLFQVDEICYFQSDTKYTRAVTASNESLIRKSLKELVEELDPSLFWQIHRSTIVNVNAISAVSRDLAGHPIVKLKSRKEALPVSQPFAHRFRQM